MAGPLPGAEPAVAGVAVIVRSPFASSLAAAYPGEWKNPRRASLPNSGEQAPPCEIAHERANAKAPFRALRRQTHRVDERTEL